MNEEYFPITKQELSLIKNNCFHPETDTCDGCEYVCDDEKSNPCSWIGANGLEDEILERRPYNSQKELEDVLDGLKAFCKEKGTNWAYDKWTMIKLIEYVELLISKGG